MKKSNIFAAAFHDKRFVEEVLKLSCFINDDKLIKQSSLDIPIFVRYRDGG
jgi:hypothetical protein